MREIFLNSQELLDVNALALLNRDEIPGLLTCSMVRWNERIQLCYFVDDMVTLTRRKASLSLDELTAICSDILVTLINIENYPDLSAENVSWDMDSIYIDEDNDAYLICLPAVLPVDALESRIFVRRVYALLEEIFSDVPGGEAVCRQMEAARNKNFGDWQSLKEALSSRIAVEEEMLTLKSVNTAEPFVFKIGHEDYYIGADPEKCQGCILGAISVSPLHALIGWNDISYYLVDLGSREGTYLNDIRIMPHTQVPFGKGSIIKFAECTFTVE